MPFGIDDAISIGGGLLDFAGGIMSNNANNKQAKRQMEFQQMMRATQYQTAVADLKEAGLNPMLAYTNGGAGTPPGAQATMQNVVGSAVSKALEAKRNAAEVENMKNTNDKIIESTKTERSQQKVNEALAKKAIADARLSNTTAASVATNTAIKSPAAAIASGVQPFVNSAGNFLNNAHSRIDAVIDNISRRVKDRPTMDDLRRRIEESR